ncbi:carbohydrate kinase family protein [Rubrolithibacter danxiaensis]|uniref:carbohydrate kinase family protein n=1 Tax=Rubrolithibacter danxiaensis TaxID=3390805 RepID=UPI003BF877AF
MDYKVVCFGEILWDRFGDVKKAGGAPMNVAFHLNKQGISTELISAVGADENGNELLTFLREQGLTTSYVQTHSVLQTGVVDVYLDEKQQATYNIVKPVAWDAINYSEKAGELIRNADAVVFGSLACREETSKQTLLKLLAQAKFKVFDMNLRFPHFTTELLEELLLLSDIVKLNEDELNYINELYEIKGWSEQEQLNFLLQKYRMQLICVTLGGDGAMVWDGATLYKHPGYTIEVADTVGAGDAFLASFINGILKKEPIETVLEKSCAAGALIASLPGANPHYTLADIYKLYQDQSKTS